MSVAELRVPNWRCQCPRCGHIEASERGGCSCGNCGKPAYMVIGHAQHGFTDEQARLSHRKLVCSQRCGWFVNQLTCSKCGASISGRFFKASAPIMRYKWVIIAIVAIILGYMAWDRYTQWQEWSRIQQLMESQQGR